MLPSRFIILPGHIIVEPTFVGALYVKADIGVCATRYCGVDGREGCVGNGRGLGGIGAYKAVVRLNLQHDEIQNISRTLGHSSIRTTHDIYGHVMSGGGRSASKRFVEALKQASG